MNKGTELQTLIADMKAAAEKTTPLQLDTAQSVSRSEGYFECPCCEGAGEIEEEANFCNFDGVALGVQFYGIGEHHGLAEKYLRQVTPANVLKLIAALEQAQQRIDELEAASVKQLCVKLPPRKTAEYFVDDTFGNSDLAAIYNACRLECEVRIKNAGGTVEGEQ